MLVLLLYQFQEKSQKGESPGRGGCCNTCHLYPREVEGIMGNKRGMMQLKQEGNGMCWQPVGGRGAGGT